MSITVVVNQTRGFHLNLSIFGRPPKWVHVCQVCSQTLFSQQLCRDFKLQIWAHFMCILATLKKMNLYGLAWNSPIQPYTCNAKSVYLWLSNFTKTKGNNDNHMIIKQIIAQHLLKKFYLNLIIFGLTLISSVT